jgi:hypothetical protein
MCRLGEKHWIVCRERCRVTGVRARVNCRQGDLAARALDAALIGLPL